MTSATLTRNVELFFVNADGQETTDPATAVRVEVVTEDAAGEPVFYVLHLGR